ncbi:hypothetical protein V6N11_052472 [Hibiscus sabdariffa]|uniref:RNase H type-1 domain-containing protein n=1 Tax=Hibiscus sabdariffa TaxID=183260 RepID=A0ABR2UA45_9ROSI
MPHSFISAEIIVCRWSKPPRGWIKVNTDWARNPSTGFACCGEVDRDENMHWCFDKKEAYRSLSVNNPMMITFSLRVHFAPMLNRDCEVRFEWVSRECNMMTDRLAKAAIDLSLDYHHFLDPPLFVVEMLNADALVEP